MRKNPATRVSGVYSILNRVDGKVYVGSSSSLVRREKDHRKALNDGRHGNRYLQRAYRKYGAGAFTFQVLEHCKVDDCVAREQVWMDKLRSANPQYGYNLSPTAGSVRGVKFSDESKLKVSQDRKRYYSCPAARQKARDIANRRWSDPEQRAKMSEKIKGTKYDADRCAAMSEITKRAFENPKARKNLSDALKLKWTDPEFRARMRAGHARRRLNRNTPNPEGRRA